MGDPNPAFGPFRPAKPRGGDLRIISIVAAVTAMCPCGNPDPLVLPAVPGAAAQTVCGKCRKIWHCDTIEYEEKLPTPEQEIPEIQCKLKVGASAKVQERSRIEIPTAGQTADLLKRVR